MKNFKGHGNCFVETILYWFRLFWPNLCARIYTGRNCIGFLKAPCRHRVHLFTKNEVYSCKEEGRLSDHRFLVNKHLLKIVKLLVTFSMCSTAVWPCDLNYMRCEFANIRRGYEVRFPTDTEE